MIIKYKIMTKEEKIKEAWGKISDKINEDGWLYFGYACDGWDDVEEWLESNKLNSDESHYDMVYNQCDNGDLINVKIRPKSLQGIENNNGWIKIESEDDLPKDYEISYHAWNSENDRDYYVANIWTVINRYHLGSVTHYQPIVKPKPPIY